MLSTANLHRTYVWIPLFGSFLWISTLLSMLFTWLATGRPKYVSQDGSIAYISDVGADILKPLFVTGCCITAVSFSLSLIIERWLRHSGRLIPHMRNRERVFGVLAALSSVMGGAGLILLSCFDTKRHPQLHQIFLLVFMVGVVLSAVFTVVEYKWLSKDFVPIHHLRVAYKSKAIITFILTVLAIAFGITLFKNNDVGAILEWIIAVGFTFYLLTFYYDLRLSKGVGKGELSVPHLAADGHEAALARQMREN